MTKRIKKIQSILIANRGEIALRVIRACKELGIRSVAIYSDADKQALHARLADEAIAIGGNTPGECYLDQEKVVGAALQAKCDAVHPGYGFLSENPVFAKRVEDSGIIFIGPSAEAIRMLGDKMAAKAIARRIGVPTAGGSDGAVSSPDEVKAITRQIGFPIVIKAAAGGGGKGMRVIERDEDLANGIEAAQREAHGAFGDARVFVEKYLFHPRHIEFQVLADSHGNVVHLGERECSVQRRHQKVVEESPSVKLTPELRKTMGDAACALIREAKYQNAGTVEFLVDAENKFYFLEVNTRLQVEHPVTELVTGIDLVHNQIAIAEGRKLEFTASDIKQRGWAIECRIMAENPLNNFLPATGRIDALELPTGVGVRNDSALFSGQEISPFYDSMLGKLIVHAADREEAMQKMRKALKDFWIAGVPTSIPFCLFVLNHPQFISGNYSTNFIAEVLSENKFSIPEEIAAAAVSAAAYFKTNERRPIIH